MINRMIEKIIISVLILLKLATKDASKLSYSLGSIIRVKVV